MASKPGSGAPKRDQVAIDKLTKIFKKPAIVTAVRKSLKSLKYPGGVKTGVWSTILTEIGTLLSSYASRRDGGSAEQLAPEALLNRVLVFVIQPLSVVLMNTYVDKRRACNTVCPVTVTLLLLCTCTHSVHFAIAILQGLQVRGAAGPAQVPGRRAASGDAIASLNYSHVINNVDIRIKGPSLGERVEARRPVTKAPLQEGEGESEDQARARAWPRGASCVGSLDTAAAAERCLKDSP